MSLVFNGNSTIDNIVFNGYDIEHLIYNGVEVWSKQTIDYSTLPLTFKILTNGSIVWKASNSSYTKTIRYRKNGGTWYSMQSSTSGYSLSVTAGDILEFTSNSSSGSVISTASYYNYFTSTCEFEVYGNIQSLYKNTGFETDTTNIHFRYMFAGCTGLKSVKNMIIPMNIPPQYAFEKMFNGCTGLVYPPVFKTYNSKVNPESYAFSNMFYGCTSLLYTPTFTLGNIPIRCCDQMFYNCTTLKDSYVSFDGTSIAAYGCNSMFYNCKNLTDLHITSLKYTQVASNACRTMYRYCAFETAPELPATSIGASCYYTMFSGNTKLKHGPTILPATTLYNECYRTMFSGCSNLENAPELPATTLVTSCYHYLLTNCSKINYIKCLATSGINTTNCNNWVSNVAASGTFVKASSATWGTGVSAIPSGWTVETASS